MTPRRWRIRVAAGRACARRVALYVALATALLGLGGWLFAPAARAMGDRGDSGPGGPGPAQNDFMPGEVIVQFQDGVTPAARDALLRRLGMRVKRSLGGQNAYLVTILDGSSVPEALARLRAQPEVRHAEPNRIVRLHPPRAPQGTPGAK